MKITASFLNDLIEECEIKKRRLFLKKNQNPNNLKEIDRHRGAIQILKYLVTLCDKEE